MRQFFKFMFASFLGVALFSVLCLSVFLLIMTAVSFRTGKKDVVITPNSILKLSLDRQVQDRANKSFDIVSPFPFEMDSSLGLYDILRSIEHASRNDKIEGISLESNFIMAGLTQIDEIRNALIKFKESGKFITSYSDFYSQGSYYIASVADSVFLNPVGLVDLKGISTEVNYYKRLGNKYGVKFNVFRAGKFKSAVEPYLNEKMSEQNRFQLSYLVSGLWERISTNISKSRGIDLESLINSVDSLNGYFPKKALRDGLVDKLFYKDQYRDYLRKKLGIEQEEKINFVSIDDYISSHKQKSSSSNKIAIVYAQGIINYGEANQKQCWTRDYCQGSKKNQKE